MKINGIEWVKFKEEDTIEYYVTKDVLSTEILEDIVDDNRYLSENEIIYNNDVFNNNWEDSYPRRILNDSFKEKYLNGVNILGEVRLLIEEEVKAHDVVNSNSVYWTMSPSGFSGNVSYARVFSVYSNGNLYYRNVYYSSGLRPVIAIEKNAIEEERNLPEKIDISNFPRHNNSLKKTAIKLNEIIDYLRSKGE